MTATLAPAPLPLATADRYASQIVEWLGPYVGAVAIAGSIRRRRPVCGDVDLVIIPKIQEVADLTGAVIERRNLTAEFLHEYVASGRGELLAGKRESPDLLLIRLPKCQLDVFFADDKNWGTRLLCRTGSKEHNIWLCQKAYARGLHWHPYRGVKDGLRWLPAASEQDVFDQLGLGFIPPERRER